MTEALFLCLFGRWSSAAPHQVELKRERKSVLLDKMPIGEKLRRAAKKIEQQKGKNLHLNDEGVRDPGLTLSPGRWPSPMGSSQSGPAGFYE